jgi:hypothetical protein
MAPPVQLINIIQSTMLRSPEVKFSFVWSSYNRGACSLFSGAPLLLLGYEIYHFLYQGTFRARTLLILGGRRSTA